MSPVLPRTLTTPRRHMLTPPTPDDLVTSRSTSQSASRSRHPLPPEATHLLTWFSSLTASMQSYGGHIIDDVMVMSFFYLGWQRLEVVQMVVTNLDPCELYFFAALLMVSPQSCKPDRILSCPAARAWKMFSRREYLLARLVSPYPLFLFLLSLSSLQSRQFRDFVSCLPEALALRLLSFVPPKDLLKSCTRVRVSAGVYQDTLSRCVYVCAGISSMAQTVY